MDSYEAIVYDLDGTLVDLRVDWAQARVDTVQRLRDEGVSVSGESLWELLEKAQEEGYESHVETVLSSHEREGALSSSQLRATKGLPHSVPTGVCTLNCEAACKLALETHEIDGHIDTIVARDTLDTTKPDPEPLLETVRRLAVSPAETLFVGDSERDERTAERAAVDFQYVSSYLDTVSTS